jgi:hypothetical protein
MTGHRNRRRSWAGLWLLVGFLGGVGLLVEAAVAQEAKSPRYGASAKPPAEPKESRAAAGRAKPAQVDEVRVYRLRHAKAASMSRALASLLDLTRLGPVRLTADERLNAIIVSASPEAHAQVAELIQRLDFPAESDQFRQIRVFHLKHADADFLMRVVSSVLSPDEVRIGVDPRANSVIVAAPAGQLAAVEALLLKLDEESVPKPDWSRTFHVRIVWLASGLGSDVGVEPAGDLKDVLGELEGIGVRGLRQVGQAMVYTLPNGRFQIGCAPMLDEGPAEMTIRGELDEHDGVPRLSIELSADQMIYVVQKVAGEPAPKLVPGAVQHKDLVKLETEIAAPPGHYVVLGVTPVGKTTSVFVVQITPSK